MEFKIEINNCLTLIGIIISLCNYKYCYMLFSTIIGIFLINFERHNIKISSKQTIYIIYGFIIGILSSYFIEIFMGLMFSYFLCNYNLSNKYLDDNYNNLKNYMDKYSIRLEDGYIIKHHKTE